jgi:hypothetical protein
MKSEVLKIYEMRREASIIFDWRRSLTLRILKFDMFDERHV